MRKSLGFLFPALPYSIKNFMKKFLIATFAIGAFAIVACNNANNKSNGTGDTTADAAQSNTQTASIKEIVSGYLQLKNALANDDGKEAANGGKAIVDAMQKFDKASLNAEQKKTYEDIEADMKENAEHIAKNAGKIDHQREHFEMLSQDMYDMVKTFNAQRNLYKDYCPMYNDNKGAFWLSETKEIKNPYLGKKMPACGEVKEEIKQ